MILDFKIDADGNQVLPTIAEVRTALEGLDDTAHLSLEVMDGTWLVGIYAAGQPAAPIRGMLQPRDS